jgi:hypothetical protein
MRKAAILQPHSDAREQPLHCFVLYPAAVAVRRHRHDFCHSPPVPEDSAEHVNAEIRRRTDESVLSYAEHSVEIDDRLWELDNEWDIERTLEANAAAFSLLGLTLALTVDRRWLALPIGVAAFLLQHVVQGWCPPVPVFRRLGFRTVAEIDEERYALKVLRGDFQDVAPADGAAHERARDALDATRC